MSQRTHSGEKRTSRRILSRVRVHFGPNAAECLGFALNLSARGLYLSSTRIFPPPTALQIRLEPVGVAPIELRGQVRWGLQVPQKLVMVVKPGMGVRLESPPREYLDFFSRLMRQAKPPRTSPRVDARLEVRFYHRDNFVKVYTENISRGGIFIATEEILEPGAEIGVDLVIPDLASVWHLTGRVAYRLDADTARHLESPPGVGVELTDTDPDVLQAFRAYVQRVMRLYE